MQNNQRTIGIIATTITGLLCGCSGLFLCIFGALSATGNVPLTTEIMGDTQVTNVPPGVGVGLICLALLFIAVPILVGFFTLRKKPVPAGGAASYPAPDDPTRPTL